VETRKAYTACTKRCLEHFFEKKSIFFQKAFFDRPFFFSNFQIFENIVSSAERDMVMKCELREEGRPLGPCDGPCPEDLMEGVAEQIFRVVESPLPGVGRRRTGRLMG